MPRLTKSEYAKHRREAGLSGGSAPAVTYAVQDGRITVGEDGLIDPVVADKQWADNTDPVGAVNGVKGGAARAAQREAEKNPPPPQPDPTNVSASRAAREYYDAGLSRLKYEQKAGILIPVSLVKKVLYEAGRIIRAGHDEIVSQLSPDLASETDIAGAERILKLGLDKLDNELADKIEHLDELLLARADDNSTEVVEAM